MYIICGQHTGHVCNMYHLICTYVPHVRTLHSLHTMYVCIRYRVYMYVCIWYRVYMYVCIRYRVYMYVCIRYRVYMYVCIRYRVYMYVCIRYRVYIHVHTYVSGIDYTCTVCAKKKLPCTVRFTPDRLSKTEVKRLSNGLGTDIERTENGR